ncbi:putative SbcC-type recombination nuclease [Bacillus phage JL]|uniref:SbcC-type recombination nuclease n=1 Tax=Bacillus phage JL TaxID=1296655 RepID=S5MAK2_9CAUD|nr:exonuclease [Bacillus phage JL]AGR46804.1 putative SbcC-type recombination nuclease [Bacillus phage JL]
MRLGELEVQNFLSIQEASIDLSNKGLVLVQGDNKDSTAFDSNGSGKSTLVSESPTWCIYGKTIRGFKPDKVVNRIAEKDTRVSLKIYDDMGDEYQIVRHRKHREYKNHVLLYRNGENITGKSDTDTDKMIEDIIGMDFVTFSNSIMFGQGAGTMFALATDATQKQVLERMLQIELFKDMQEEAKKGLAKEEMEISKFNSDIQATQTGLSTIRTTIEDLQNKEAALEKTVDVRIGELNKELEETEDQLSLQPSTKDLEEDKEEVKGLIADVEKGLASYETTEKQKTELLGTINALEKEIDRYDKHIRKTEKQLDDVKNKRDIPENCSACGQALPLEDTTAIENHLQSDIDKNKKEREEAEDDLEEMIGYLKATNKKLEKKKPLEASLNDLRTELAETNSEIKSIDSKKASIEKSIASIKRQIKEQEDLKNSTFTEIIEKNIEDAKVLEAKIQETNKKMEEHMAMAKKYEFWVNGFSNQGIKSVLLDSVTPFLNERANYYLSKLTESTIEVEFTTQEKLKNGKIKDKFSVKVTNIHGDDEYKGNSNGEKRRVDVAINMALQDLVSSRSNKKLDIIVYDEVFDGLDEIGCNTVIELLQEKAKIFGTVIVITHNEHLKQLFNKYLNVVKEDGRTVVLEFAA